jgi:hypothetical protein
MEQACRVTSFPVQPGGFCEATLAFEHRAKTGMEKLEPLKIPHAAYYVRVAKCVFEPWICAPSSHVVGHPAMLGRHAALFVTTSVGRRTTASHADAFWADHKSVRSLSGRRLPCSPACLCRTSFFGRPL